MKMIVSVIFIFKKFAKLKIVDFCLFSVKFRYSEEATKFEKIFPLRFDVTE